MFGYLFFGYLFLYVSKKLKQARNLQTKVKLKTVPSLTKSDKWKLKGMILMERQSQNKKTIALLLLILFVVSLTAIAVSAEPTKFCNQGMCIHPTPKNNVCDKHKCFRSILNCGPDPSWRPDSRERIHYDSGYQQGLKDGKPAGIKDGYFQGQLDCQSGRSNNGGDPLSNFMMNPVSSKPYDCGYMDGYNDGYFMGWNSFLGYDKGYNKC